MREPQRRSVPLFDLTLHIQHEPGHGALQIKIAALAYLAGYPVHFCQQLASGSVISEATISDAIGKSYLTVIKSRLDMEFPHLLTLIGDLIPISFEFTDTTITSGSTDVFTKMVGIVGLVAGAEHIIAATPATIQTLLTYATQIEQSINAIITNLDSILQLSTTVVSITSTVPLF
jgi:hypothetical protein